MLFTTILDLGSMERRPQVSLFFKRTTVPSTTRTARTELGWLISIPCLPCWISFLKGETKVNRMEGTCGGSNTKKIMRNDVVNPEQSKLLFKTLSVELSTFWLIREKLLQCYSLEFVAAIELGHCSSLLL